MATIVKVKRLSNPRRVVARRKPNPKRKMTAKQIRHFGTKRQKAALRRKVAARRAPVHRVRSRPVAKRKTSNPAWVVTLGPAVNPKKRSNTMPAKAKRRRTKKVVAKRRRRVVATSNPKRRRSHRRRTTSNPKVVVRYRTRRPNRRRRVTVKRNNPTIFGSRLGSKDSLTMIGGGLAGVVATKFLPTLVPTNMTNLVGTNLGRVAVSAAAALVSGWAATKFVGSRFGDGVYFGGFMQVASVGLNTFLPTVYKSLGVGLGDFVPGQFAVPQNPVRQLSAPGSHAVSPSGSLTRTSSLGRAYAPAY